MEVIRKMDAIKANPAIAAKNKVLPPEPPLEATTPENDKMVEAKKTNSKKMKLLKMITKVANLMSGSGGGPPPPITSQDYFNLNSMRRLLPLQPTVPRMDEDTVRAISDL